MTDPLAKDIAAFERMRAELEAQHLGKFVVFHDGKFIGSFDTLDNAAHEAVIKFGQGPYLIRKVGEADNMPMPASVAYRIAGAAR
jgi:hypothetical protein